MALGLGNYVYWSSYNGGTPAETFSLMFEDGDIIEQEPSGSIEQELQP
tara:strand:+ start:33 stop:176 length:144 start_codon:yes stop_codon:yes gene_type:complete